MNRRRRGARAGDLCPAGRHPVPEGWVASTGCRGCLNDDTLADTVAVIVAALPGAAAGAGSTVRQALLAVVEGGSRTWYAQRYRQIVAYLAEHPDGLTSGASTTPVDVARLITALRGLGRDDVVDPRCADCGRTCLPRHHRTDGLRICITCDGRRRHAACGQCGHTRPIFRRLLNGSPLCQPCHQADPGGWETCGRCGESAPIQVTVGGVRIGQCCYLKPHERCSVCGLGRAVSPYASGKATCADCASQPHGPCVHCGLDAPVNGSEEPVCLRCRANANRPCRVCGTATVSRDRDGEPQCSTCIVKTPRTCGGCGRRRVIARRADGDNPDLCGSCWRGPTVIIPLPNDLIPIAL